MSTLGLGLLTWYYAKTLTRPAQAHQAAQAAAKNRAQGEMTLPPLGPIESPFARKDLTPASAPAARSHTRGALLGPPPPLPPITTPVGMPMPVAATGTDGAPVKSPGELAFERRLAGPAFARASKDEVAGDRSGRRPNSGDPAAFCGVPRPRG